jgi:hypothetical protein
VGLLIAGCVDDDGGEEGTSRTTRSTESSTTTTTTQPAGSDPAAVTPYVSDLVARLDAVTDQIVRDPTVVLAPESDLIAEFTSIYAPGSDGLTGGLDAFRQSAEAGTHAEPVNGDKTRTISIEGPVTAVDEDHVKVAVCYVTNRRVVDRDGATLEYLADIAQPGEIFAVRYEGEWRLERSDLFENTLCTQGEQT